MLPTEGDGPVAYCGDLPGQHSFIPPFFLLFVKDWRQHLDISPTYSVLSFYEALFMVKLQLLLYILMPPYQANSCLIQEWLHMAGGHNKVEYCFGSHLKERGFRSIGLSLALALTLRCGLWRIVACNEPTPALFRSGCNGPEATIKSNSALSHILRRVVFG